MKVSLEPFRCPDICACDIKYQKRDMPELSQKENFLCNAKDLGAVRDVSHGAARPR